MKKEVRPLCCVAAGSPSSLRTHLLVEHVVVDALHRVPVDDDAAADRADYRTAVVNSNASLCHTANSCGCDLCVHTPCAVCVCVRE